MLKSGTEPTFLHSALVSINALFSSVFFFFFNSVDFFFYFNHILKPMHPLHLKTELLISICKPLSYMGRHWVKVTNYLMCSWKHTEFWVRSQNAWLPPLRLRQHGFLRFPRPDSLTQWFQEFRQKSPDSSFFGCIYLEMLMEANWGVEEGRNVCDDCIVVHTVLRNSLQMLL